MSCLLLEGYQYRISTIHQVLQTRVVAANKQQNYRADSDVSYLVTLLAVMFTLDVMHTTLTRPVVFLSVEWRLLFVILQTIFRVQLF